MYGPISLEEFETLHIMYLLFREKKNSAAIQENLSKENLNFSRSQSSAVKNDPDLTPIRVGPKHQIWPQILQVTVTAERRRIMGLTWTMGPILIEVKFNALTKHGDRHFEQIIFQRWGHTTKF